jgi:hypothetical protein
MYSIITMPKNYLKIPSVRDKKTGELPLIIDELFHLM